MIDQSKEALNFQITIGIAYVIAVVLTVISFGILFFLPTLVWIANIVFCILAAVKANNGEDLPLSVYVAVDQVSFVECGVRGRTPDVEPRSVRAFYRQ